MALCRLLLQEPDVLLLDEPTNHLDLQSKSVLKQALEKFEGTLILVSHDRDFLQGLCDRVFEFRDQKVKEFLGGISDYLAHKKMGSLRELEQKSKVSKTVEKPTSDYHSQKERKKLQNTLGAVERSIQELEEWIKNMDFELEINYEETIQQEDFSDTYHTRKKELEQLYQRWENLQEKLAK